MAAVEGQYAKTVGLGVEVLVLAFSTFGGMSPDVVELLWAAAEERGNKLRGGEYDSTTWAARTWLAYTTQRLAVTLARAVAWELASAMEVS